MATPTTKSIQALDLQPRDGWATHAIAHCMEMNGKFQEGIRFMESTVNYWQVSNPKPKPF